MTPKLSLVVPCFNETATLETCVSRVLAIASPKLAVEIVIVDDASQDDSLARARDLAKRHAEIRVLAHDRNRGKGAALRTGFAEVTGDYVAVQDADLEYDPRDLLALLEPLVDGRADAVLGSRFLTGGAHRVLYFWHSAGNAFLTLVSNVFTDLNLSDIETCYKVFRREVIQSIEIEEERFGFEPEIVAKLARRQLRIYEVGIRYDGRTYGEGKKIRARDGWRALYCILRYNARHAPWPLRLLVHLAIGLVAGGIDVAGFALLLGAGLGAVPAAGLAYAVATAASFALCRALLYPLDRDHLGRGDGLRQGLVAALVGALDVALTLALLARGFGPGMAKLLALLPFPALNFLLRDRVVFEGPRPPTDEASR
ncbi:MAG: glycosyltransferase family 2 protein [Myxococcota bacterium]